MQSLGPVSLKEVKYRSIPNRKVSILETFIFTHFYYNLLACDLVANVRTNSAYISATRRHRETSGFHALWKVWSIFNKFLYPSRGKKILAILYNWKTTDRNEAGLSLNNFHFIVFYRPEWSIRDFLIMQKKLSKNIDLIYF